MWDYGFSTVCNAISGDGRTCFRAIQYNIKQYKNQIGELYHIFGSEKTLGYFGIGIIKLYSVVITLNFYKNQERVKCCHDFDENIKNAFQ